MAPHRIKAKDRTHKSIDDGIDDSESLKLTEDLPKRLIFLLFVIRLFNAFSIKTFFQPDEYYQSLEPAHRFIYNYGYRTWEWKEELRSSIHPLIYAGAYKLASFVTDDPDTVVLVPKLVGAIQGLLSDIYLHKFVYAYTGDSYQSKVALYFSLFSTFNWFFITRSFSNAFEMLITTVALAYWPWKSTFNKKAAVSFALGLLCCTVRPTNALIWAFLGLHFVHSHYNKHKSVSRIVIIVVIIALEAVGVFTLTALADRYFYGRWTFPLYNFVEFNFVRNLSVFYGVAPWHFYIFQGLPMLAMTYLPFLVYPFWKKRLYRNILGQLMIFIVFSFSLIQHKEIRFIYPLQPVILLICSVTFTTCIPPRLRTKIAWSLVLANTLISYFFTHVHERGAIDVVNYIRSNPRISSVGFLTPCHSTPWQSHLHRHDLDSDSWFLTCEPPLHLRKPNPHELRAYKDESDQFYDDPLSFLSLKFPSFQAPSGGVKHNWPSAITIFQPLEPFMDEYLADSPYTKCKRFFNSYFHWDSRRQGDIVVYCKMD